MVPGVAAGIVSTCHFAILQSVVAPPLTADSTRLRTSPNAADTRQEQAFDIRQEPTAVRDTLLPPAVRVAA